MQYTKYLATGAILSILSVATLVSAATGDTATGTTTIASTGTITTSTTSLEVKGAPRLVKKTADSVVLEWDAVPSASAYIVKYSKTSVATSTDPNAQYDNETDQVSTTGAVITKLSSSNEKLAPATPYYFSVVAIDKDGKESDTFSDELMVTTDAAGMTASSGTTALAIKDLAVSDDKTISLSFNSNLSTDPVRVKITKTSDNSDVPVGTVVQDQTNLNTVVITTLSALSPASSYTLTVLSAKDSAGNTIQEGVNGLKEFTTAETLAASASTPTPTLYAAGTASGTTMSGAVDTTGATKVATGAKTNIIVLAALLLSLGIVTIYRRKLV
ncbi:MAG: fibronectin type III domain-containing protein [Candidatus Gracilibacteria bacterium]|nr:fibronectin type III domain-containing protein [Candidatus Gracilibacteria bacterium]